MLYFKRSFKEALAAIGSTTVIVNMLVFFFNGFSVGAACEEPVFARLAAFTVSVQASEPARKAVRLRRFRAAFFCHWQRRPGIPPFFQQRPLLVAI